MALVRHPKNKKQLPVKSKGRSNVLRYDPSRTNGLRRTFSADLNRRFRKLRMAIIDLVDKQDAFGLREREPFDPTANSNPEGINQYTGRGGQGKLANIRDVVKSKYGKLETRYGPKYAKMIMLAVTAMAPTTTLSLLAVAEIHRFISAKTTKNIAADDYELSQEEIQRVARKLLEELEQEGLRREDGEEPANNHLTTNAGRFAFDSDPEKLEAFQEWLRQQFLGYLAGASEEELWNKFIMAGFKKGAGRAYDDYHTQSRWDLGKGDFYAGSKKQFLQSSFAQPESIGKVKLLASRSFDELQNVTADMSNKMSRVLTSGLVRGMNPHDVAREMADDIDIGQNRATVIARTEIVRAHAEGQLQAFEDMGVEELGVMVEWSTAGDDRVCDDCEPMEGVVLKLDEAKGMIPRHPQCRCAFIPANVGEDKEGQSRTKGEINAAIRESHKAAGDNAEDWGPGQTISKERPVSILNTTYVDRDDILSNFLATNANPYHDVLGRFAAGVNEAAESSPTGKFGDNKTFISHVHAEYNKGQQAQGNLGQTLEMFKGNLLKASKAGLVTLSRADLPHLMNPKDVNESHTKESNADFHFVTRK